MRWKSGPTPASSLPQKLFATERVASERVGGAPETVGVEEGDAQEREAEGSDGAPGMARYLEQIAVWLASSVVGDIRSNVMSQ